MSNKPTVMLVGSLPPPFGGVTVFLRRLVNCLSGDVDFYVLDMNPSKNKEKNNSKEHYIGPAFKLLRLVWVVLRVGFFSGEVVHFHFSRLTGLALILMCPRGKKKFILTLHNGEQHNRWNSLPWITKQAIRLGARKIDRFLALCQNHRDFYRDLGVDDRHVIGVKSQISPGISDGGFIDDEHELLRHRCKHIVVSSGYVNKSYNYEFVIKYVNENPSTGGILFLYGQPRDLEYLKSLEGLILDRARLLIYFDKSESEFLAAVKVSDAYLRPTFVDSWGIAVADAVLLGVPAVASNVCERIEGAVICDPTDYKSFSTAVSNCFNSCNTDDSCQRGISAHTTHLAVYCELSELRRC